MRIGPTPWVSTSQPASVSIGGPQLPSCTTSQARSGTWTVSAVPHRDGDSESATPLVSRSGRDSAANRPPIRRGNSARPLLAAASPTIGDEVKDTKSVVRSSCWLTSRPSKAV